MQRADGCGRWAGSPAQRSRGRCPGTSRSTSRHRRRSSGWLARPGTRSASRCAGWSRADLVAQRATGQPGCLHCFEPLGALLTRRVGIRDLHVHVVDVPGARQRHELVEEQQQGGVLGEIRRALLTIASLGLDARQDLTAEREDDAAGVRGVLYLKRGAIDVGHCVSSSRKLMMVQLYTGVLEIVKFSNTSSAGYWLSSAFIILSPGWARRTWRMASSRSAASIMISSALVTGSGTTPINASSRWVCCSSMCWRCCWACQVSKLIGSRRRQSMPTLARMLKM